MTSVRALRMVEVETPPAFSEATPPELFERLRLVPVPVLFQRPPQGRGASRWIGVCPHARYTEIGEVVLDARLVETALWEPRADLIQAVYLHEVAHRLMPEGYGHGAAFGAMSLVLHLRAGKTNDFLMWHRITVYDFCDEGENVPRAFAWAWKISLELAPTERTAEECAALIVAEHTKWCTWLAGEEERQQARHEAARATTQAIEDRIKRLKESRLLWALGGLILGAGGAIRLLL